MFDESQSYHYVYRYLEVVGIRVYAVISLVYQNRRFAAQRARTLTSGIDVFVQVRSTQQREIVMTTLMNNDSSSKAASRKYFFQIWIDKEQPESPPTWEEIRQQLGWNLLPVSKQPDRIERD